MRILIVHNILWAHYKASVFQALQQLVDRQAGVTVRVLQIARNEKSRAGLETTSDAAAPTYNYDYDLLFDRFLEDVSLRERAQALLRQARTFRPDVINLTGYYDPAQLLLLLWARSKGIKVVMQSESTAADQTRNGWKERFKRWVFGQCDGFFCFGNQSADYLIRLGVAPENILLRKNAVDNDAIRLAYERALPSRPNQQRALGLRPQNIVFVGRLIAIKNLPALLTAFDQARQQVPTAEQWGLILLGDGSERDTLHHQIDALGLTDAVRLLPGRPWFRVPEVLALSDALVLPSRSEPWGLVVNEAMVCGLPVIVSDRCGCVPDLVRNGQNGLVFDPNRPNELVDGLVAFMNGTIDLHQLGQAARESVIPYSPAAVAQEMLAGFRHVLADKTAPVVVSKTINS